VRTTRGSLNRNESHNKEGNATINFIPPKQLANVAAAAAKRRPSKKIGM
jgi:hypothetical protein